jgi:hypothetical protein
MIVLILAAILITGGLVPATAQKGNANKFLGLTICIQLFMLLKDLPVCIVGSSDF